MKRSKFCSYFLVCMSSLLLTACHKESLFKPAATDPLSIFEETWMVVNERYALFPDKGLNWDSVHSVYRNKFTPQMSERALFSELSRMLETLRDGHLTLISPFDTASYSGFYSGYPRNFSFENVLQNYLLSAPKKQGPLVYDSQDGIGYIYYKQFTSKLDRNDLRIVVDALSGTKGLIVDVRDNTGGFIQAANRLASIFIKEPLLVKFEQYKSGTGREQFTDPLQRNLLPEGLYYPRRVIVLTNRSCFSACNDFVLYMKSIPQVKTYGDQTGGGGSIPASYRLANGWFLQYSSSRTLSPKLQSVEMGILPDRNLGIGVLDDLRGRDPILEAAFFDLR
jgi:hypothetical protein